MVCATDGAQAPCRPLCATGAHPAGAPGPARRARAGPRARRLKPGALPPPGARLPRAGGPPPATIMATRSAQDSRRCGGMASTTLPVAAAAGPTSTISTPATQASLTSLCPPYAAGSSAKTTARTARAQSHRKPWTPKIATTRGTTPAASSASASKALSQTHSGPAPACSAAGCMDGASPGFSCGRRVSETAWFGWWRLGLVLQVMQHHSVELPRRRYLFWSRSTREVGLAYPCNVHEQLLTFFVLHTREECPDKRFDRVTRVGILQRTSGPACNELFVKLLFPPLGLTTERNEFVH